ncbi:MAG TPA: regulatory protein RecX [Galbitalea sp.]|jgi:regulatory protein|nr:regulatory protein RecX [Galbitalea sp.]
MNGAEERLARVTYLPGVQPPAASAPSDHQVPLESIPGLVKASELSSRPNDLPGKRFAGHTGEIQRLEPVESPTRTPERSARAHNVSLNALARRGVSSAEMASLLGRRDLDQPAVEAEIGRLQEVGLLDDAELARTLVRTLRDRKGLGRTGISAELRRRKIDAEVIENALEEADSAGDADELTRARELATRRAPQLRSLDPETARRRLGAFLMRKGYSGSIVASAVASALAPNHPALRSSAAGHSDSGGPRFQ